LGYEDTDPRKVKTQQLKLFFGNRLSVSAFDIAHTHRFEYVLDKPCILLLTSSSCRQDTSFSCPVFLFLSLTLPYCSIIHYLSPTASWTLSSSSNLPSSYRFVLSHRMPPPT